jgi:ribosome biogenesis protein Nip4
MKDLKNFRLLNYKEKKIIEETLINYSSNTPSKFKELKYQLYILLNDLTSNNKFPLIYLVPNSLVNTINSLEQDIKIISSGIYFGFIKKNKFYLSVEGAEFLHTKNFFSKRHYLKVNKKGEKSILYGNKIKKGFIIEISYSLCKKDFLLVLNQSNELIAIGQSQVNYKTFQNLIPKNLVALNLVDKGYYLRKKQ